MLRTDIDQVRSIALKDPVSNCFFLSKLEDLQKELDSIGDRAFALRIEGEKLVLNEESDEESDVEQDKEESDDYKDEEDTESKDSDEESDEESDDEGSDEDDEEKVDESCANSAEDTSEYDLQYIMRLISGGMNGEKRDQSVGNITKIVK
jgi:hypothetical protein